MRIAGEAPYERSSFMRGIFGLIVISMIGLSVLALSLATLIPRETRSSWTVEARHSGELR